MYPVVCHDITNRTVYTKIIYTNVNKDKSMLMYHHSFVVLRCSATCFDLQEFIIRSTYNSIQELELIFVRTPDDDFLKVETCSGAP
jgi:hypothetical protein